MKNLLNEYRMSPKKAILPAVVVVVLIFLAQIILLFNALLLRIGFPYFTDGDVKIKENIAFTSTLSFICITLFACAFGYFLHAAYTDAENEGLPY